MTIDDDYWEITKSDKDEKKNWWDKLKEDIMMWSAVISAVSSLIHLLIYIYKLIKK